MWLSYDGTLDDWKLETIQNFIDAAIASKPAILAKEKKQKLLKVQVNEDCMKHLIEKDIFFRKKKLFVWHRILRQISILKIAEKVNKKEFEKRFTDTFKYYSWYYSSIFLMYMLAKLRRVACIKTLFG